jgi:hypothetical protein
VAVQGTTKHIALCCAIAAGRDVTALCVCWRQSKDFFYALISTMPEPDKSHYKQKGDDTGKLCSNYGPPVPVAAIAGGVGGGIALIAIVAAVVIAIVIRRRRQGVARPVADSGL